MENRRASLVLDLLSSVLLAAAMARLGEWVLFGAFVFEVILSRVVANTVIQPTDKDATESLVRRILRDTFSHLCEEKLLCLFRVSLLALAVIQIALHLGLIDVRAQMAACACVLVYMAIRYFAFVRGNYRLLGPRLFGDPHGSTVLPKH